MGVNLLRYDDSTTTSKDDAILYEKTVGQTGIISGCVLTHLGANQVRISSGKGVYKGRDFNVVEEILLCAISSSGTVPGRIYVHIDLSDTVSPIELLSVASSSLPDLVDDDNFNDNFGIGDMELGTYSATTIAISGLVQTSKTVVSCQEQINNIDTVMTRLASPYSVTLPSTSWQSESGGYYKTVTLTGLLATDKPRWSMRSATNYPTSAEEANYKLIKSVTCAANTLTFHATAAPSAALTIEVRL